MKVLTAQGVTNARGKPYDLSWVDFCKFVQSHNIAQADESLEAKRSAPWASFAEYDRNHRRRENLKGDIYALSIDLDGVTNTAAVEKILSKWEYIAWTTWRSTPETPRWRIILPIENGIAPERFEALARRITRPLEALAKVDPRVMFPEQLWFLPWHKRSMVKHHTVWENHTGRWIHESRVIEVNFEGVKISARPEEIGEGEGRNNVLVQRLNEADALRCASEDELRKVALDWNARLKDSMSRREVLGVVRKTWKWMQRGDGLRKRADAWKGHLKLSVSALPAIGTGLMSEDTINACPPESIVGDFLYPGCTLVTAKMKEGKSFLAMQLALSVATGVPFLASNGLTPGGKSTAAFDGFQVHRKGKVVIIAGEDTPGGIKMRFMGSIASGYLPATAHASDIRLVYDDDLDKVRAAVPDAPGLGLFESLVERWYSEGYRVICIDPLRVLEASLRITEYPGVEQGMNVHARDFLCIRYFMKVAQAYGDLCILVSLHHGKNKRDHDASDPGDMIAGSTGYGAAAMTTISILPAPPQLDDEDGGDGPRTRELYFMGRHTKTQRLLIKQHERTGLWRCEGDIHDTMVSESRSKYLDVLYTSGVWMTAEAIGKRVGTKPDGVHKILHRCFKDRMVYKDRKLMIKKGPGGGYRLM